MPCALTITGRDCGAEEEEEVEEEEEEEVLGLECLSYIFYRAMPPDSGPTQQARLLHNKRVYHTYVRCCVPYIHRYGLCAGYRLLYCIIA